MTTISSFLTSDHRHCDDCFDEVAAAVASHQWETARACFLQFSDDLEHHLAREEQVLFPAFESATGIVSGPTSVMRSEHQHIRGLLVQLKDTLGAEDANAFLGHTDTLNIMMQQHNLKEETMLYKMADRVLSASAGEVLGAMRGVDPLPH